MSADITPRSPRLLIYNPQLWGRDALMAAQTARNAVVEALVDGVRASVQQEQTRHQLAIGDAGSGKTMLACCVQHTIEEDHELSQTTVCVRLPDQQLNIAELSDFYANAVSAFASYLADKPATGLLSARLRLALQQLPEFESKRTESLRQTLDDLAAKLNKRLVLVVDDFDRILARLGTRRRKFLASYLAEPGAPLLVTTASTPLVAPLQALTRRCAFDQHVLAPLQADEARALLASLADRQLADGVRRLVKQQPARIDTLTALAGRQPRSIALLFEALTSSSDAASHFQLESYLDRRTPQYQARIDALPTQAQLVFDALARRLSPARASQLGETLRLETNAVSSQLHRLVKAGLVEKVPYDPPRRAGFQVAERTMNLWYLMRAGGACRHRLATVVAYRRLERHAQLIEAIHAGSGTPSQGSLTVPETSWSPTQPLRLSHEECAQLEADADLLQTAWAEAPTWVGLLIEAAEQQFPEQRFSAIMQLMQQAVQRGHASEALQLLSAPSHASGVQPGAQPAAGQPGAGSSGARQQPAPSSLAERWQPLLIPLRAVVVGHQLPMRRLAPELRSIAHTVLRLLSPGKTLPEQPS